MNFVIFLLLAAVPFAHGSSTLEAKSNSAYCTGNLTINLVGASCYEEDGCTFGSDVFLTGQGKRMTIP
jgi:hypothetical protein